MHQRLAEILTYMAAVRSDLTAFVEVTPRGAFARRTSPDRWTGAQILQHLGQTEGSTAKFLEGFFAKALADGIPAEVNTTSILHSLDHFRIPDRKARQIVAPPRVQPAPDSQFDTAWASLQRVRERTLRAVAPMDGRDLSTLSAPHPAFGVINGYEWVLFLGQHEARHLDQLREAVNG